MTVLLVIAGAWLGLLLLGLGMLHVATSTPTPRPVARRHLASVGDAPIRAAVPEASNEAPRGPAGTRSRRSNGGSCQGREEYQDGGVALGGPRLTSTG